MAVYIIEPLLLLVAGFVAVIFMQAPLFATIALILWVAFRIRRAIVHRRQRAEDRNYKQAVIALAQQQQQQGSHQP
jgi:hypothetical protein